MPSEHRIVAIAAGHTVKVRRSRQPATRPGFVMVEKSHRAPFEVPEQRWQEAPVA
ncbi:hypothetical protein [Sphingomonas sp.]|uniref:hypothetical protein n=1 Tax=Sphingomonas sp. TaxID=28214 RepID=UPI003B00E6CA